MGYYEVDVPDALLAFVMFLRQQVGDRVMQTPSGLQGIPPDVPAIFRPEMPQGFQSQMPAACIICRPAGGYTKFGKTQFMLADPRVDINSYAPTQGEAVANAQAIALACKLLILPQVFEECLLNSAMVSAGPTPLPDTQTLWPCAWMSVQLVHGELPKPQHRRRLRGDSRDADHLPGRFEPRLAGLLKRRGFLDSWIFGLPDHQERRLGIPLATIATTAVAYGQPISNIAVTLPGASEVFVGPFDPGEVQQSGSSLRESHLGQFRPT